MSSWVGPVDPAFIAGIDRLEQPFGVEGGGEASSTWVEVSSTETISVSHFRETRSSMINTAIPTRVKGRCHKSRSSSGCTRPIPGTAAALTGLAAQGPKMPVCFEKDPAHRRRSHPHPAQIGAVVSELAVGPVDLTPLVEQRQNLRGLLGQDGVHRARPGGRSTSHRCTRRSGSSNTRHADRQVQPCSTASTSRSNKAALVAASTRCGTRHSAPTVFSLAD